MKTADDAEKICPSWPKKPIVLVGLMGAGKSTIGRRLAKRMGLVFVDADDEIEKSAGCTISDIFALHGESIFRDLEQRVIKRLLEVPESIIATGGGAWMQEGVRAQLQTHALNVWLRAPLEVLLKRVEKRNHRPLLETGDKREILARLMAERYPIYEQANIVVDSGKGDRDAVVDAIIEQLAKRQEAV